MGTQLGHHLHKVRFAITSKGTLLTIYDKTDQATITDKELKALLCKNGLI